MISVLGSLLVPLVLLQRLNKVEVVEFDALVCEVWTQKLELVVTKRNFIVVENRAHTGEWHSADFSDVLVLEERL